MLWQKSKAVGSKPSEFLGLRPRSYEAYCLDEAVIYFGLTLENMLEDAGQGKPGKEERKAIAAREQVMNEVFGKGKTNTTGFADPALMFK